jgi:alginate O-acetyltransferase complex protein AlgI
VLFNSFEFLLFLPIVFILYWFVANKSLKWQNVLVLVASYFFYGWWSWKFMILLAVSTFLDYMYGFYVASPQRRKAKFFLWLSIINNLGILAVFKYYNFFAVEFQNAFELLGIHTNPVLLNVALPIGISFYTFHGMSYVFDIYRGRQKPVADFVEYAVFVAFFPLLVAGPIERANHLLPQVQKTRVFNYSQAVEGCRLILWGLFKKVVIADSLAGYVDNLFQNYENYNGVSLIVGAIAFSIQIYGDFSGYSDIAIGTAKLFGIELLSNFKFPYFSRDIAEFWRRWHISLSSWFRDYLYIPLGGSQEGKLKSVRNTFIIFLVSGFWHGASWTFILWGGIHAIGFLPLLLLGKNRKYVNVTVAKESSLPSLKEVWQMGVTFAFVTIAWVFFRSEKVGDAIGYLRHIVVNTYEHPDMIFTLAKGTKTAFIYIASLLVMDWYLRKDERRLKVPANQSIRYILYWVILLLLLVFFTANRSESFIYFQF